MRSYPDSKCKGDSISTFSKSFALNQNANFIWTRAYKANQQ